MAELSQNERLSITRPWCESNANKLFDRNSFAHRSAEELLDFI